MKNPPATWEMHVQSLYQEDRLEKEMGTHSSMLAWGIPQTEELGGLERRPVVVKQIIIKHLPYAGTILSKVVI